MDAATQPWGISAAQSHHTIVGDTGVRLCHWLRSAHADVRTPTLRGTTKSTNGGGYQYMSCRDNPQLIAAEGSRGRAVRGSRGRRLASRPTAASVGHNAPR